MQRLLQVRVDDRQLKRLRQLCLEKDVVVTDLVRSFVNRILTDCSLLESLLASRGTDGMDSELSSNLEAARGLNDEIREVEP